MQKGLNSRHLEDMGQVFRRAFLMLYAPSDLPQFAEDYRSHDFPWVGSKTDIRLLGRTCFGRHRPFNLHDLSTHRCIS
jgi:hypothetical protein